MSESTQGTKSPEKNRSIRHDWTKLVNVVVGMGPSSKTFAVHESILCSNTEFFKHALIGNWKEAEERLVKLPEEEPEIFRYWLDFAYCGKFLFDFENESKGMDVVARENLIRQQYDIQCRVYVLSDRLQDNKAKNASIHTLYSATKRQKEQIWRVLSTETVTYVYHRTVEGSLLRQLLVDLWSNMDKSTFKAGDNINLLPAEFIADLFLTVRPVNLKNIAQSSDPSKYFEKE